MRHFKVLAIVLLPLFFVSLLCSQDLTQAAKKEKARREALKGKKVTVISNSDLSDVKKRPSVAVETTGTEAETEAGQAAATEAQNAGEAETPADTTEAAPQEPSTESMPMSSPTGQEISSQSPAGDPQKTLLETNWLKAKEYADLLELKVNSLWQDFYSMDDMVPKDKIQEQLADTFDKYQRARADEAIAKEELDKYLGVIK